MINKDPLKLNNPIIFLINPNITLYHFFVSLNIHIKKKETYKYYFNPYFLLLLIVKSFKTSHKNTRYGFIYESFALN